MEILGITVLTSRCSGTAKGGRSKRSFAIRCSAWPSIFWANAAVTSRFDLMRSRNPWPRKASYH